jgi:hypothetical protein
LFDLVHTLPDTLRHENHLILAESSSLSLTGAFRPRSPAAWIAADVVRVEDGKLADTGMFLQDEATKRSPWQPPMFGDRFPEHRVFSSSNRRGHAGRCLMTLCIPSRAGWACRSHVFDG